MNAVSKNGGTVRYEPTLAEMEAVQALDTALVRCNAADGYLSSFTYNAVARSLNDVLVRMFGAEGGNAIMQIRLDNHGEPDAIQQALDHARKNFCHECGRFYTYGCSIDHEEN